MIKNKRYTVCLTVGILTAALFACTMLRDQRTLYYDADDYWTLSAYFGMPAVPFSSNLLSAFWSMWQAYPLNFRGYFFPFLLRITQYPGKKLLGDAFLSFRLASSLNAVLLAAVLLPLLLKIKLGTRRWIIGAGLSTLLLALFWSDLIVTPLSDLPALAMYVAVLLLLRRLAAPSSSRPRTLLFAFGAGFLAYGAYNTRTVYLVPLFIAFAVYAVIAVRRKITPPRCILILLGLCLGFLTAALPQMIINLHTLGHASPIVNTGGTNPNDDLITYALRQGTGLIHYESFAGDPAAYTSPAVNFLDRTGSTLFSADTFDSIGGFILWVFRHFLSACYIYTGHLISYITLFYANAYLPHITIDVWVFVLNCSLYLGALLALLAAADDDGWRHWGSYAVPLALLLLPAALTLLAYPEPRYFIPCYLLVYLFLTQMTDYKAVGGWLRRHWLRALLLTGCLFLFWCFAAGTILGSIEYGVLTFEGYFPPQ